MFLILGAAYLGYPYATLYRIDLAVKHADAATLRSLVDWYSVREGLKEDICDMVMDGPVDQRPSNELAPFGASFVRGMAGNALDKRVTPETLVSLGQLSPPQAASTQASSRQATSAQAMWAPRPEDVHIQWAFFTSPTEFLVDLRTPDAVEPIRLEMELRDMKWQVRRVRLPNELLEHAGPGT
jgi:hypothetical protein